MKKTIYQGIQEGFFAINNVKDYFSSQKNSELAISNNKFTSSIGTESYVYHLINDNVAVIVNSTRYQMPKDTIEIVLSGAEETIDEMEKIILEDAAKY